MKLEVASWLVSLFALVIVTTSNLDHVLSPENVVFFVIVLMADLLLFAATGGPRFKRLSPYFALVCVLLEPMTLLWSAPAMLCSGLLLTKREKTSGKVLLKKGLGLSLLPVAAAALVRQFYGGGEVEIMLATTVFMIVSLFLPPPASELRLSILPLMCAPGIVLASLHFLKTQPLLLLALIPAMVVVSFGRDETFPRLARLRQAFSLTQQKLQAQTRQVARYSQILVAAQFMSSELEKSGLERALQRSLKHCGLEGARVSTGQEHGNAAIPLNPGQALTLPPGASEEQWTIARILSRIYQDCFKKTELHAQVLEALEETRRSQATTLASSRLAAVGRLAAGVAHEVNTPIGAIMLSVDLGERYLQKDLGKVQSQFDTIKSSAEEVRKSVKRFLQYSQPDRFEEKSWFGLSETLDDSLNLISFQRTRSKVALDVSFPENLELHGRRYDFHILLSNLLLNACQACEEVESARVRCRGLTQSDGSFLVEVVDNGPGVPPEHVKELFQPFFTTRASGEGSGLGLYLAAKAAESLGASVRYRDTQNQGALFQIRFPADTFRQTT